MLLPKKYRSFYVKYPMFHLQLEIVRDKNDKEFVGFLLSVLPNLKRIIVGYDFRFGKDRFSLILLIYLNILKAKLLLLMRCFIKNFPCIAV